MAVGKATLEQVHLKAAVTMDRPRPWQLQAQSDHGTEIKALLGAGIAIQDYSLWINASQGRSKRRNIQCYGLAQRNKGQN